MPNDPTLPRTTESEVVRLAPEVLVARAKRILIETPATAPDDVVADAARRALACIEAARRMRRRMADGR